jgi:hypothetical protein
MRTFEMSFFTEAEGDRSSLLLGLGANPALSLRSRLLEGSAPNWRGDQVFRMLPMIAPTIAVTIAPDTPPPTSWPIIEAMSTLPAAP